VPAHRLQGNPNSQRCDPSADRAHPDVNQDSPVPNLARLPRTGRHRRAAFPDFQPQKTERLRQESSEADGLGAAETELVLR